MKKLILTIVIAVLVLSCGGIATYAAISHKTADPKYGYYTYQGKEYPVSTKEQKELIEKYDADGSEYYQKEILIALGVVEDNRASEKMVRKVLSKLDTAVECKDVIAAINTVAGSYDIEGGSGTTYYIYLLQEGRRAVVRMNGTVIIDNGADEESVVVFWPGMGYSEKGWSRENVSNYLELN